MDEKIDVDKIEDTMLPGFRFHPTDEELVGFYLKRKIQQKPLHIELIKQVNIYKYEPWDLPKLAASGEGEWYFYCPRDRKYRNSARPNRVTVAGFWKATGTDRPIYSSNGTKCIIGLKKSLVFYRGRAAKGIKTDWMMHEFRLPSLLDSKPPKKLSDKSLPPNDAWAICRIFKKTNSMAQRALSQISWISSLPEAPPSDTLQKSLHCTNFSSDNISCTAEIGSAAQLCSNIKPQQGCSAGFSALNIHSSYKTFNPTVHRSFPFPVSDGDLNNNNLMLCQLDMSGPKSTIDASSMLLNPPLISDSSNKASECIHFGGQQQQLSGFEFSLSQDMGVFSRAAAGEDEEEARKNSNVGLGDYHWGDIRSMGFPFNLSFDVPESWDSPQCPSEMSTTYSNDKCYT